MTSIIATPLTGWATKIPLVHDTCAECGERLSIMLDPSGYLDNGRVAVSVWHSATGSKRCNVSEFVQ